MTISERGLEFVATLLAVLEVLSSSSRNLRLLGADPAAAVNILAARSDEPVAERRVLLGCLIPGFMEPYEFAYLEMEAIPLKTPPIYFSAFLPRRSRIRTAKRNSRASFWSL